MRFPTIKDATIICDSAKKIRRAETSVFVSNGSNQGLDDVSVRVGVLVSVAVSVGVSVIVNVTVGVLVNVALGVTVGAAVVTMAGCGAGVVGDAIFFWGVSVGKVNGDAVLADGVAMLVTTVFTRNVFFALGVFDVAVMVEV